MPCSEIDPDGTGKAQGMDKMDAVMNIKLAALFLQENPAAFNPDAAWSAKKELDELVDRFYEENKDFISENQYKRARDDYNYFMILIESAINHYRMETSRS
jgi:hypothetical protein